MFTVRDPVGKVLSDQYTSSAPEEAREWHRRLARWLAGHDGRKHVTSAFSHAVAGEDWELMDQLWSENIVAMIAESVQILADNLAAVPADVLRARPSMEVLRDVSRTAAGDTDRDGRQATRRVFADASTRVANQQWNTMPLGELLILATGHLIDLRLRGRLQDSAAVGDLVNARVTALAATEQTNKSRSAWFSLHRGLTFSLLNDEFGAVRAYKRAVEYATGSGVEFVPAHAAANLALTYALRGDTVQAQEWLGRHRGFDTADWPGHYVIGIGGHVAAGLLALDRLDYVAVSSELAHLGDGSALFELWPFIAYLHSQHALHAGRAPEALAHLDHLRASTDGDDDHDKAGRGVAAVLMWRARADLLIACGRGEKARQLIRAQGANKSWSRVPAARARLLAGHDAAGAGIDPLTWDPATSIRDRLEMLLLGAVGALRCADSRNALRLVNQAFDLYGETGNLRPFAAVPAADRAQLFDLAGRDVRPDDAVLLARQGPVYPDHLALIDLSPHEQSVLEALAQTSSRRAIADSLFVSINTVKTQLAAVYQKLGSTTREEALRKAREHELLPPG